MAIEHPRLPTLVELDSLRAQSIAVDEVASLLGPLPWQLKGASGLLCWLGPGLARVPQDLDIEVQAPPQEIHSILEAAVAHGGNDRIQYLATEQIIFTPGGKRPTVYRLVYEAMDGRITISRSLCELIVSERLRRTTSVPAPWPEIAGMPQILPVATVERLLSEKLRRYAVHRHGGRVNTRWIDLLDMLLTVRFYPRRMEVNVLHDALLEELSEFGRPWIEDLPYAPREWLDFWDAARLQMGHDFGSLDEAEKLLHSFWRPVLDQIRSGDAVWSSREWRWQ
jgi:hypothetical protein